MTARLIWASLTRRFRQLALIALAVALAAGTVATLAGFARRADEGLGDELAAFGPNLVVRPQVGGPQTLAADEAERIRRLPGVMAAAGWVEVEGDTPLRVAVERAVLEVHPRWQLEGTWPGEGQVLLGAEVAPEAAAQLRGLGELEVVGTLDTGSELNRALFRPAARGDAFHRIEVRTERGRLDEVVAAIESRVAGAEAQPLRRVSAAEAGLVHRLTLLLAAVSAAAVALALISVIAATTALMEVRRSELGLMMALGYSARWVSGLFALELVTAALLAGLVGAAAGEWAAGVLTIQLLGPALEMPAFTWSGPAAAALAAVAVVGCSLALAVGRSERLDAAQLLQGGRTARGGGR